MTEEAYGPDYFGALYTRAELGDLHLAMGDHDRAREYLDRAIRGTERALGPEHHAIADPQSTYGRLLVAEGKPRGAVIPLEVRVYVERESQLDRLTGGARRSDDNDAAGGRLRGDERVVVGREVLVTYFAEHH